MGTAALLGKYRNLRRHSRSRLSAARELSKALYVYVPSRFRMYWFTSRLEFGNSSDEFRNPRTPPCRQAPEAQAFEVISVSPGSSIFLANL